jgi:ferredoxin hydrogenase large subunit
MSLCARCGNCWRVCPEQAIEFEAMLSGRWEEVATMELVHCQVCGEPLYTSHFGQTLAQRVEKPIEALCPFHKKTAALDVWKRVSSGRGPEAEERK